MTQISRMTNANELKLRHAAAAPKTPDAPKASFGQLLQQKTNETNGVHFSKHASMRVRERGIEMNERLLRDLNEAVDRARAKGAKDVVVIGSQSAFIVNVPNNVVVTTMTGAEMKNNIFTNIDSAVLM